MKSFSKLAILAIFLVSLSLAAEAHPGPPGHSHGQADIHVTVEVSGLEDSSEDSRTSEMMKNPQIPSFEELEDLIKQENSYEVNSFQSPSSSADPSLSNPTNPNLLRSDYSQYLSWLNQYQIPAPSEKSSFLSRLLTFSKQNEEIQQFLKENPNLSYQWGLNEFSDLSDKEFQQRRGGLKIDQREFETLAKPGGEAEIASFFSSDQPAPYRVPAGMPPAWNWATFRRRLNNLPVPVMNPVQDQGGCGACAIFTITALLETSDAMVNKRPPVKLSEQNVMDCAFSTLFSTPSSNGANGCNGNQMRVIGNNFLFSRGFSPQYASNVPYTGDNDNCKNPKAGGSGIKVATFTQGPMSDGQMVFQALRNGPIAVSISPAEGIRGYNGGIMNVDPPACQRLKRAGGALGEGQLSHAMILVGYGTENGRDYWILRNSWGVTFGGPERGFLRVERGKNICNLEKGLFSKVTARTGPLNPK